MTEVEWLACEDPAAMLQFAAVGMPLLKHAEGYLNVSNRKLLLFAAEVRRRIVSQPTLTDDDRYYMELLYKEIDDGTCKDDPVEEAKALCKQKCLPPHVYPDGFRPRLIEDAEKAALLREIVGNPFRVVSLCGNPDHGSVTVRPYCPACNRFRTPTVLSLAQAAYEERVVQWRCAYHGPVPESEVYEAEGGGHGHYRDPGCWKKAERVEDGTLDPFRLALVADALEEAGCDDEDILRHLRGQEWCRKCRGEAGWKECDVCNPRRLSWDHWSAWVALRGPHVRGCWALDLILGKE